MLKKRRTARIKAEMNLTPLIDVMVCLLVVFMVTAPLMTSGIPMKLPKGDGKSIESQQKTLDINIDKTGIIFVGTEKIPADKLLKKIEAVVRENRDIQMIISADSAVPYGQVIELMATLRVAGFTQVALKTDPQAIAKAPQKPKGK